MKPGYSGVLLEAPWHCQPWRLVLQSGSLEVSHGLRFLLGIFTDSGLGDGELSIIGKGTTNGELPDAAVRGMIQTAKRFAKRIALQMYGSAEKVGLHVLPVHYYTPIPDRRWLVKNKELWIGRTDLTGIVWELDDQMRWLRDITGPYYDEIKGLQAYSEIAAAGFGLGYGPIESQVLHCFLRYVRPKRIVEVGSGVSTACMAAAVARNGAEGSHRAAITCIEPYPRPPLLALPAVQVHASLAQAVPQDVFASLEGGDVLFIDSSHAVKTGSDDLRLYLEIIPNLKPGVLIHIHDVYLPYLYQRDVLWTAFFWQETALLLALLNGHSQLRVLCSLSALHYDRSKELAAALTDYAPQPAVSEGLAEPDAPGHFPSSIYLQTQSSR